MSDQPVIIDTPDAMEHYRMCQVIAGLKIQANTGMTLSRGSLITHSHRVYGTTKNTAKACLKEMLVKYEEKYGRAYGS